MSSTVNLKWLATWSPGADAPYSSIPKFNPNLPVNFCQPLVIPASIETNKAFPEFKTLSLY